MKDYEQIEFGAGTTIDSAMKRLLGYQLRGRKACGMFNGEMLYSDVDDMNSAYVKILGKTKEEYDREERIRQEKYEEHKRKHKEAIPKLTEEWIEKGKKILDEKYVAYWRKIVPIRLSDLYEGMELGACLEIVKALNRGCRMNTAKKIIEKQGHSGMSFGLVRAMVAELCDRGKEFASFVR